MQFKQFILFLLMLFSGWIQAANLGKVTPAELQDMQQNKQANDGTLPKSLT
jgi:hypothetical protein